MTREETLRKLPPFRLYGEDAMRGWLLDSLQALDLLSLDEPLSASTETGIPPKYHKYNIDPGWFDNRGDLDSRNHAHMRSSMNEAVEPCPPCPEGSSVLDKTLAVSKASE